MLCTDLGVLCYQRRSSCVLPDPGPETPRDPDLDRRFDCASVSLGCLAVRRTTAGGHREPASEVRAAHAKWRCREAILDTKPLAAAAPRGRDGRDRDGCGAQPGGP